MTAPPPAAARPIADPAVAAAVGDPVRWILEVGAPYWAMAGVDREKGGFFDRLNGEGQPVPEDVKHVKYQARQIYAFCHAHLLGAGDEALAAAKDGWRFLGRRGWDVQGGWVHTITRAGRPLDGTKDLYDHAFMMLALAWLARATGDDEPLRLAARTVAYLDRKMVDPHGGGGGWGGYFERSTEGLMEIPLPRRQNPHMHLLEALLALHATSGEAAWLDRARQLVGLVLDHMIDPATGQMGEYYGHDWQPAAGAPGRVREPGHHFEWVWLLLAYRAATGDDRVVEPADRLYRFALSGVDTTGDGPLAPVDETDPDGGFVRDTKRLWCQTEAIKAFVARAEHLDDADAAARARDHLAALFTSHMSPDSPIWRDQLSREGTEVSTAIPAGNLYHIVFALAEAGRVLGRADAAVG
jgi:mannose/cellobiose epimerase-like protein (N-acyl-D-glucosamine 2-epimerase family)